MNKEEQRLERRRFFYKMCVHLATKCSGNTDHDDMHKLYTRFDTLLISHDAEWELINNSHHNHPKLSDYLVDGEVYCWDEPL